MPLNRKPVDTLGQKICRRDARTAERFAAAVELAKFLGICKLLGTVAVVGLDASCFFEGISCFCVLRERV